MTETNNLYSFGMYNTILYINQLLDIVIPPFLMDCIMVNRCLQYFIVLDDQVQLKFSVKPNVIVLLWMY